MANELNLDNIDLGSFGINEKQQLNTNVSESLKVNPDSHAKTVNLSKQSGVPAFAVESDPAQVEYHLKLNKIDLDGMRERSPATSDFLTKDFNNAVIAQEDMLENVLESIEKTFKGLGSSIRVGYNEQAAGFILSGVDKTPQRVEELIPMDALPMAFQAESYDLSREYAANFGIETDEQLAEAKKEAVDTLIGQLNELEKERQKFTPEDLNIVQEGIRAGVESIANMAPGLVLTLLSGGRAAPMLATMGVQTYAGSYGAARKEGKTPEESNWYASIDAAIEVGTELLPTKTLSKLITGKSKGFTKEALKFAAQEMTTEQLATVGQSLNSYMFDLDKELMEAEGAQEVIDIMARRQAVTAIATIVAGGSQITAAQAVNKTVQKLTQTEQSKEAQGQKDQQSIDSLNTDANKSKLRERDVELFKQFIQEADADNNTHVFIDGVQTALYLQEKTREEIESDPALTLLDNAIQESRTTGADVAIPVEDFMGDLAGNEAFVTLREHMTLQEDAVSPFHQEQHRIDTLNYVKTMIDEASENASEYTQAQDIYTTVRDQLIDTGMVNATNASTMAQIVPAWATAQARRTGRSVQEVYESAGLTIEGPQTGEKARLEGEQVLSQPIYYRGQPENAELRLNDKGLLWVTTDMEYASDPHYGGKDNSEVIQLDVDESNLFDYSNTEHKDLLLTKGKSPVFRQANSGNFRALQDEDVVNALKELGFDGFKAIEPEGQPSVALFSVDKVQKRLNETVNLKGEKGDYVKPTPDDALFQSSVDDPRNLFVAHNITAEGIAAAEELGGLAAPSIAVANIEAGGFESFGEITLLANPEVLNDPTFRTFDADVYSPRQPRSIDKLDQKKVRQLSDDVDQANQGTGLRPFYEVQEIADLDKDNVFNYWLTTVGKAPKLKKMKATPLSKAVEGVENSDLAESEQLKQIVADIYKKQFDTILGDNPTEAETELAMDVAADWFNVKIPDDVELQWLPDEGSKGGYAYFKGDERVSEIYSGFTRSASLRLAEKRYADELIESGQFELDFTSPKPKLISDAVSEVRKIREGFDQQKFAEDLAKKNQNKKLRSEFKEWMNETYADMLVKRQLFKGYTPMGDRKYAEYTLNNVVREMTRTLQGGENTNYGVASVRSRYANELSTKEKVQAVRGKIVSSEEMSKIKDEAAEKFEKALEELKPHYKFDSDSWGYGNDVAEAITQGPSGVREAFGNSPEARKIIDELGKYLALLPTEYFEAKVQRAMDFSEFNTAIVPKGASKKTVDTLKSKGLKIRRYDPNVEGSRAEVVAKQTRLLFQDRTDSKSARGYYDPENSIIRLTESADLSTFLHEFAHFMYEMELRSGTELGANINSWFRRNSKEVAKEANKYLGKEFDPLKQGAVETTEQRKERARQQGFDVDTVYYHGTKSDFNAFKAFEHDETPMDGVAVTTDVDVANQYAGDGHVMSLYVRGNFADAEQLQEEMFENDIDYGLDVYAMEQGYDGVFTEKAGIGERGELFIFDPKNIRSVNAQFKDSDTADLLAQEQQPPEGKVGSITEGDVVNYLDYGTTDDFNKDAAIRRAFHEQFARGFETYLMEGKAPSIELRNAFRTFARWLAQIYQAFRGKLNVKLDDQMRQVFDRLIATEEQIAAAESRARVEPMFTDAAVAGMTEEEFADYKKRQEKVKEVQSETLRDQLIKTITRETKKWWKSEKADLVDEEMDRLSKERVYSTANRLRHVAKPDKETEALIAAARDEVQSMKDIVVKAEKQIEQIQKDNDTIGQFLAKKGGLNRESMLAEGVDREHFKEKSKVFGKPLFPRNGGMTADDVAELLNQHGYSLDANEALDVIFEVLDSDARFVDPDVNAQIESIEDDIQNIENGINLTEEEIQLTEQDLRFENIKLDHATVKEMVGEEKTDKLGRKSTRIPDKLRGMTAKGQKGVHPDEAATFFGYNSGAEMLADLVAAPPMKETAEANAQAEMINRHGDVFTDGTIEQQADEAVQNEERGKLILHELKILSRGTNQRTLDRQTMKSVAEEKIGSLSFREIHPGKYRKAEIRAAQESARMLAEGNKEGAAQAKQRQALNYYLGMAATEAKNETTKIVDRMARYNKKKVREEIQKAQGGYWEQITKILERFEFRKAATLAQVDRINQDINTWAKERMEVDGDGLVLSNAVLNESYVTHWKNVPYNDLQGVADSVKNIEHVARYANKLTRMGEEIEYNKLVERLVAKAAESGTGRFKKRASSADDLSWIESKGRWAMAQMTKIPYMMSWMDGVERVGDWFTTFSQPMTDAYNAELELFAEVGKPVMDLIAERSKEDIKRHNTTYFIPEIKGTANGTHTGNLKGHEILSVALNTGNASNLKKLLLGEGWAKEDGPDINLENAKLQAVLKHMTKSDWQLVQKIWDQIDILYPKLAEVHRRTTGLVPPKVEATPVETQYGTFKGGYYPVKYDPTRDNKAAEFEERKDAEVGSMFASNASIQASVNAGATNERTGYYAPIHLTLNVVPNHIQETVHYITHHDAVREVNKLIRDPRIKDAVIEKLGPEEYAQLKPWLNDIAKDGRNAPNKTLVDAMFNKLRMGTTLGVMGFKASTGIIQISGLSNTIAEVGLAPVMQSARTILGGIDSMRSAWEFANEKSKVLKHRVNTMDREIMNAMQQLADKRGMLAAVQEVSMKHIALIQTYMVDLPSWHAAYIKELGDSGDEVKAIQYADWVIENVQGSGVTKDMAALMRNQSKTHTIFTMFMTFFSALWNLQRDMVKGAKTGKYSTTTIAAKTMFLFVVPVLFEMMMRGELSADEDADEDARLQEMLTKVALYPVATVPVVRDIVGGVFSGYNYNASPVTSIVEQGLQGLRSGGKAVFTDGEMTKSQAKSVSKLAGAVIGVPGTGQAWATGEHLYDVLVEGEDFTTHQLLFGPKREK